MDILASLAPSTAAPAPASLPAEATVAPSESFAAVLSQVDVPVADPLPVVQSAPAPTLAPALAAADTAPVMPEPAAAALPTPVVAAPVPLAEPEPVAVDEVPNAWPDQPVTAVEEPEPTTKGDSSLDDIRQRMALIESAGQLDTAAMIVAPPTPVSVPLPVVVSAESAEPAPLISSRAPAQATSLPAADDEADTPQPIDLPDAMPTLVASVADSVPSVRAQTHDSQAQSQPDPQSVFSLSAASFSPTNLAVADTVASNGLVLTAAIGSADWQTDLGQQMVDMVTRGEQQVDLRLHPAELGPLSISLNLNDGTTQAQFQAAHASVRAAVEQALPQLREALATQGIALGQASVSDQSSRQAAGGQTPRDPQAQPSSAAVSRDEALPAHVQQVVLRSSGVDLYV
ncbi:flagellar hook-length control protein FliK [Pseudomonas veronii]|uniref:flagellar hook-length control protein FliK n=1 Tax=Pseudomonas veronii TaxID=76761 RepID=UPI001E5170FD|nr:flagellar hook-length control protein FliK [Pseudomonas veronii]UHH29072.1 flagellar hook-length control protein FliK [Pseudomonas veronii]WRU61722.1 flagellar hook-length control protein FliK [Pseudomonas veronii]